MDRLQSIEEQIRGLGPEELNAFRQWFAEYDAAEWDKEFESDAASGRLDALADRALKAHQRGESTPL